MKILKVVTLYLPDFVNGASILCQNITDELKKGHEVKIYCGYINRDEEMYTVSDYKHKGVDVRRINLTEYYDVNKAENYYNLAANSTFREYLTKFAPDIVHFHSIQGLGAQLIDVAADLGVPFVITMHDWWWICNDMFLVTRDGEKCRDIMDLDRCDCMPKEFLRKRKEYLIKTAHKADAILTSSNYLKESLMENGFARDKDKITVNVNGLMKGVKPAPKKTTGKIVFTYIGGEWLLKGVDTILGALMEIGEDDRYEARLYGADNYLKHNDITPHGSIKVLPRFGNEKIVEVFSDSDVVIIPSLRESFSLVTREAFLCGVPVIASDCGGTQEIVDDGVNGFLFRTSDHKELAKKMKFFIERPEKIKEFSDNIDKGKIVSIESQVKELITIYEKAMKSKRGKYHVRHEKDCEITAKKAWINDELHTLVERNSDKMAFYLDAPFLYTIDNIWSSNLYAELDHQFTLNKGEHGRIVDTLCKLRLLKDAEEPTEKGRSGVSR